MQETTMSKKQEIISISSTYKSLLYPKVQYYGENVKPIVQEIDKVFVMNSNSADEIKSNDYWLYEILLINVDDVYDSDNKCYRRKTTQIIIKRQMLSPNMLIE